MEPPRCGGARRQINSCWRSNNHSRQKTCCLLGGCGTLSSCSGYDAPICPPHRQKIKWRNKIDAQRFRTLVANKRNSPSGKDASSGEFLLRMMIHNSWEYLVGLVTQLLQRLFKLTT